MEPFIKHTGLVAPMDRANVDTDQIIPKQFLKRIERTGYGQFLFNDWRFNENGTLNPEFELNKSCYQGASILVAGVNFGSGSSREHAPWALMDYGFRCIIAPSFADIFYNNCFKNCILPIIVDEKHLNYLFNSSLNFNDYKVIVNLNEMTLSDNKGFSYKFNIDPYRRKCLLEGLDDISLTLMHEEKITLYENKFSK